MGEKPKQHYLELHKKYVKSIVNFSYSFEKGDKDPLKKYLDKVKKLPNRSISGEKAIQIYEQAKAYDLEHYQPIIKRVYLGQLLLKIKPDGSPGFISFIKLIKNEIKSLNPLVRKQITEIIKLVKKYGAGGEGNGFVNTLQSIEKQGEKHKRKAKKGREGDPVFDDNSELDENKTGTVGTLESFGKEMETLKNLDPFQTVVYKLLIEKGYRKFKKKIMDKTGGWKKFVARKEGIRAVNDFQRWIVKTTRALSFTKGKSLVNIFDRQLASLRFPSLKITVAGVTVADNRNEARQQVVNGLKKMRPLLQSLSGFPPALYQIIGRPHSYATGKNRAFLNRYHRISVERFKKTSGDTKYLYEFIALALDRIKDDHEFVKLSNTLKPVIAKLLKGSPVITSLSKMIFKKPISQLSSQQITYLLDYVLPSKTLNDKQKEHVVNKKMIHLLKEIGGYLSKIQQKDPEKFRLIANVLHIAKNDLVAIASEKDPGKAKKMLTRFTERFNLVRKLLGKNVMKSIKETNQFVYMFIAQPKTALWLFSEGNKDIAFVKKRMEKLHQKKRPKLVVDIMKDAKLTKKYLQKRFKHAVQQKNISLVQKYGNQRRSIDAALQLLQQCWTKKQFKEKEKTIRHMLLETPYMMVSKDTQKYIDYFAVAKVEKEKKNYSSILGVTYEVKTHLSSVMRKQLLSGRYSFAKRRLSSVIETIIASYGQQVEKRIKTANIDTYTYLSKNKKIFLDTIMERINNFLKSVRFRDEKGTNYRLYGLNKVQLALLKRKMNRYLTKRILPRVKESVTA